MALKKNVYFADLLRAVEISLPLRQTLHVDGAEIRQVETEFEEKPEVARDEPVMECLRIPALSTSLETIQLPERFMKLIKRLKNIQLINPNFVPGETFGELITGNDSNLLIVFYVQIMPDDFVMQLHRF